MKLFHVAPLLLPLAAAIAITKPDFVSYDGYKVFRVKTEHQLHRVQHLLSTIDFEQWNDDIDSHIDIMLSPEQLPAFETLGLDSHCMHSDLGESIRAESARSSVYKRQVDDLSWYDSYHDYEEHEQYLSDLQAEFPDNSEIVSSGTSYEGRDIFGIHLWGNDGPGKPAILWHGTVHAREWITAPVNTAAEGCRSGCQLLLTNANQVVEFITLQLIQGYNAGVNTTEAFVDAYDFYIFPFVNPDGTST